MKTLLSIIIGVGMVLVIGNSQLSFAQDVIYGTGQRTYHIIDSPLKQFESGIKADDIKCDNGFSLVIKAEDGSPACVKHDTATKLVERGWALDQVQQKSENIVVNSSSVLKLSLSTNSTIIQSGHAIGITLSLDNTGPSLLNLNSQSNWPIQGLDLGGCSWLPMGIAMLDGYYTAQNISDGHPMLLHFLYPCPPSLPVKTFTFQPMSSNITVTCEPGNWASCQYLTQTKTSVAYSSFLQDGKFFNFNPGNYTLVAGDEWGDVTIQHFQVVNPTQTYIPILNDTENKTVKVVEIKMVPPYTPGGPVIQLTVQNIGTTPITHLNVILETNQNHTFNFKNITSSTPLIPGNSISDTTMLIGGGFQTESTYSLIINGMEDNMPFGYVEKIHIQG